MSSETTEVKPPHPLVMDRETKLFRYVTHDDIVRWERMEMRYENLLTILRQEIVETEMNSDDWAAHCCMATARRSSAPSEERKINPSNEDQPTETEPMITMRLSEWLRMDGEIKRLRAALAEVAAERLRQ